MEISGQQRLNDLLISAVKAGDAQIVISLLQEGADPDAQAEVDLYGFGTEMMPALELALSWFARREAFENWLAGEKIEKINPLVVKALVDSGADVNAATSSVSPTPLDLAASYDEREIAEYLLDHGADVHRTASQSETPLGTAITARSPSVVQLLLERGADPNQTHLGLTPLQWLNAFAEYQPEDPATEEAARNAAVKAAALCKARLDKDPPMEAQEPEWDIETRTEEIARLLKAYGAEGSKQTM